jgi:hypothetical protein
VQHHSGADGDNDKKPQMTEEQRAFFAGGRHYGFGYIRELDFVLGVPDRIRATGIVCRSNLESVEFEPAVVTKREKET